MTMVWAKVKIETKNNLETSHPKTKNSQFERGIARVKIEFMF